MFVVLIHEMNLIELFLGKRRFLEECTVEPTEELRHAGYTVEGWS